MPLLLARYQHVALVLALLTRAIPECRHAVAVLLVIMPLALVSREREGGGEGENGCCLITTACFDGFVCNSPQSITALRYSIAIPLVVLPLAHVHLRDTRIQLLLFHRETGIRVRMHRPEMGRRIV